jgi:hypothetical protein
LIGFVYRRFAVCLCWINFPWFASAYDTDDWAFRVATMVRMVGVIVLALGLPPVFYSIDAGHTIDNAVTVAWQRQSWCSRSHSSPYTRTWSTPVVRSTSRFLPATAAILALGMLVASAGVPMAVCMVVLMLAPIATVLGYEIVGIGTSPPH